MRGTIKILKYLIIVMCVLQACEQDKSTSKGEGSDGNGSTNDTTEVEKITVSASKVFVHPGMLHTEEDFSRIKDKLSADAEPWASGWEVLVENSHSSSSYNMKGPVQKLIRGGKSAEEPDADNYAKAFNDVAAAYQNAIRWRITEDEAFAEKSIEILNAWATTCDTITGNSNIALAAGIYGYQFANAAELMRDYSGWSADDFNKFKQWMLDVFYSVSYRFLETHWGTCDSHYWSNWDLCNIANIMSIGILCDSVEIYSYAIDYLMDGVGTGQIEKTINHIYDKSSNDDIDLGQLQESGRDQGHALLSVGLLGTVCEMAYCQGEDVYGYDDNRVLKGVEYAAKFNYANLNVPFTEYSNCEGDLHTEISNDEARGNKRPIWERFYNHYVVHKGITARYVTLAAKMHRPEGGGGDFASTSGGYDNLGFGTLMYTLEE